MTRHQERAEQLVALGGGRADGYLIFSPYNRRYLTGFTGSEGMVLIGNGGGRWLFCDFRYWEQAEDQAPDYQVVPISDNRWQKVAEVAKASGMQRVAIESEHVTLQEWDALSQLASPIQWVPLMSLTESLRQIKSTEEIESIRQAASIAGAALEQVLEHTVHPGITEREIAWALELAIRELGAERLAFDTIVASGSRGSLPHGHPTSRQLNPGDFVTIDFGAVIEGYHSDETVTVALAGTQPSSSRLTDVYQVVWEAQQQGLEKVRSGVPVADVDRAARQYISQAGFGAYFGHGTGHGVGLEIHEAPWVSAKTPSQPLESGMVITVEPGIYIPQLGGVRLEDTVVVTDEGYQRLTLVDKAFRVL
ncbi:MAG: aminopeptidase P family protein [Sulfobacillus benefaciens]|uniref:Aminopeptidase P family protein n=1 Tax=Sulfobacillus benefaciens TaxID=453960 RepID=A0A2T2XFR9_9FIRM|nr:MAG: aminopeptidase P family protein [Sulfobacillus benefaciens]